MPEDPIVALMKQEAKINAAVTKALAEANEKFKDNLAKEVVKEVTKEVDKIKGFDDKDNCKSCGKSKIAQKLEGLASVEKQASDVKQKPNNTVIKNNNA